MLTSNASSWLRLFVFKALFLGFAVSSTAAAAMPSPWLLSASCSSSSAFLHSVPSFERSLLSVHAISSPLLSSSVKAQPPAEGILAMARLHRLDTLVALLKELSRQGIVKGVPIRRIDRAIGWLDGSLASMVGIQWRRGFWAAATVAKEPFPEAMDAFKVPRERWKQPIQRLRLILEAPITPSVFLRFTLRRALSASSKRLRFFEESFSGQTSFWLLPQRGLAWVLILRGASLSLVPLPHRAAIPDASKRSLIWSSVIAPLLREMSSHTALRGRMWLEEHVDAWSQLSFFLHPPTLAAWMKEPLWGSFQKRRAWGVIAHQLAREKALLGSLRLDRDAARFQEIVLPSSPSSLGKPPPQKQPSPQAKATAQEIPKAEEALAFWRLISSTATFVARKIRQPDAKAPIWWGFRKRFAQEKALGVFLRKQLQSLIAKRSLFGGGAWLREEEIIAHLLHSFTNTHRVMWIEPRDAKRLIERPAGFVMAGRWQPWQRELWRALLPPTKQLIELPLGVDLPVRVWWPKGQEPLALAWNQGVWFLSNNLRLLGATLLREQQGQKSGTPYLDTLPQYSLLREESWRDATHARILLAPFLPCFLSPTQQKQIPLPFQQASLEIAARHSPQRHEIRYQLLFSLTQQNAEHTAPSALTPQLCPHQQPFWRLLWLDALAPLEAAFAWQILRPLAPSLQRLLLEFLTQLDVP